MAKKTFQLGDLVRYTAKFRRSVGMVAGGPIDGVVVGHSPELRGPIIQWSHRKLPIVVASANVEKKRTTRSRDELLAAARISIPGIPIGESGAYRIYVFKRQKDRWVLRSSLDTVSDARRRAAQAYDQGAGDIVLLDKDGAIVMSLDSYHAATPGKKTNPRGRRKPNTHDVDKSTKSFEAALDAADRHLMSAVDDLEDGRVAPSIKNLNLASYWAGQARAERSYAGRVSSGHDTRLKRLESGMRKWGKNFADWLKKR